MIQNGGELLWTYYEKAEMEQSDLTEGSDASGGAHTVAHVGGREDGLAPLGAACSSCTPGGGVQPCKSKESNEISREG